MAGGISLPTALQLLDGSPHRKVISAMAENIPFAKVLSGGDMGKLLPKVLSDGNLSSVLANPMAAATGALQGLAGQAAAQLQSAGMPGVGGLISSLTGASGLGAATSAFQAAGDYLSGVTGGQAGLFALAGHDSLLSMLGSAAPAAVALARAGGPADVVGSGPILADITAGLPGIVSAVIGGTMTADAATAWVQAQIAALNAVVAASNDALAQGQALQMRVSALSTVAGLLAPIGDTADRTPFQTMLATFVTPDAAAALADALADQIEAVTHPPVDTAAMTSLGG